MKYKFQLEKRPFNAEIANNATFHSETTIKVNKDKFSILIGEADEKGVQSIFVNHRLYQIEVVQDREGYPRGIFVNGEYYPASLLKIDKLFYYREKDVQTVKPGIMKSFIPGNIRKVYKQMDDPVEEGDLVLIHEAMKMENEIRSPKSGRIKHMGVKEGDNILADHVLFEVE